MTTRKSVSSPRTSCCASASSAPAEPFYHVPPYYFAAHQIVFAVISFVVLMYFKRLDYRRLNSASWAFTGLSIVLALLVLSVRRPALAVAAAAAPHVFYPAGVRAAIAQRQARCVLDAYLQLAQEAGDDLGFIQGLWRYRDWPGQEDAADARPATAAGRR